MNLYLIIALICFVLSPLFLNLISKSEKKPTEKNSARIERQKALMKELVLACSGDKATAIRLIEYERLKSPDIKTLEAIDRAAERLCGDRGRVNRK